MIHSGIIACCASYLVLVGAPNKQGYPGRLYIIYSKRNKFIHFGEDEPSLTNVNNASSISCALDDDILQSKGKIVSNKSKPDIYHEDYDEDYDLMYRMCYD